MAVESLCTDEGAERDRLYIIVLPSLACRSLSLSTLNQMDAVACNAVFTHLTGDEIAADVVGAFAMDNRSDN